VPHVQRELGQIYLNIRAVLVPPQERRDCKAVAEILHPRTAAVLVANSNCVKEL